MAVIVVLCANLYTSLPIGSCMTTTTTARFLPLNSLLPPSLPPRPSFPITGITRATLFLSSSVYRPTDDGWPRLGSFGYSRCYRNRPLARMQKQYYDIHIIMCVYIYINVCVCDYDEWEAATWPGIVNRVLLYRTIL